MGLLLVPATRENLEKSIENSVDINFAQKYLDKNFINDILHLSGNEGIRCWAVTKNNEKLFNDIVVGDEVLLTEKSTGLFTHYGVIVGKIKNELFGKALWPISGENPWEFIYFLANISKVKIDKANFVEKLGYNASYTVPGSIKVKNEFYQKLGSVSDQYDIHIYEYILEDIVQEDFSAVDLPSIGKRRKGHAAFSKAVKKNGIVKTI
jgi:hypothetical protein